MTNAAEFLAARYSWCQGPGTRPRPGGSEAL